MTETLENFLATQQGIIERSFLDKRAVVKEGGLLVDPVVEQGVRGFLVALRHDEETLRELSRLGEEVRQIVPTAVIYGADNHMTLTDWRKHRRDQDPPTQGETERVLETLSAAVREARERTHASLRGSVQVAYDGVLVNQHTVIAVGKPNYAWWDLRQAVLAACRNLGLDVAGSWGAHTTIARFTEAQPAPPELLRLADRRFALLSRPEGVFVGRFVVAPPACTLLPWLTVRLAG